MSSSTMKSHHDRRGWRLGGAMILLTFLLTGCPGRESVPCTENADCNLSGGGVCTVAPTGNQWCAYPDPDCPAGFRYSNQSVGDNLGGICVEDTAHTLTVRNGGSGTGIVSSEPPGLSCTTGTCTGRFPVGTLVTLSATATTGAFLGWSDSCKGYETCDLVMDQEHHVGALFGAPGQTLWVEKAGSSGDDMGRSIASTPDGNLVIIGEFHNTLKIGTSTFTSRGGTDVVVAKLSASTGEVIWARQFGSTGEDAGLAIGADDTGNVYVAGSFNGAITFGGPMMQTAGNTDAFVASLDPAGDYRWSYRFGGTNFDSARSLTVRGASVTVVGSFIGSMLLNGTTATSAGAQDTFIVNLTTGGAINWARAVGGTETDVPNGVAMDGSNNVVVVGRFSGTTSLGGSALTSAGFEDLFIAKYRGADGVHLFSKRIGSVSFDSATAVAVDTANNIYVLGTFYGTVDFGGPTPLTATSANELFLAKYSLVGAYSWARSFGPDLFSQSLVVNSSGDLALSGMFCGTISFGGDPLSSVGSCMQNDKDIFAVRLRGGDGSHINSVRAGGTDLDVSWGATQLEDGRVFVTGGFSGFAEFGGEALTSDGGYDLVVLGLAPL